jgi:transposase
MIRSGKTRNRDAAIAALLEGKTIEAAAAGVGISRSTLLRWLKDEAFLAEYNRAKASALKRATGMLMAKAPRAVEILSEVAEEKSAPHQGPRERAASAILKLGLDAFSLENLEERIRRLEAQSNAL